MRRDFREHIEVISTREIAHAVSLTRNGVRNV